MPANETKTSEAEKPEGWETLAREGSREGAQVGWDDKKKLHYHVLAGGEIIHHERPADTRLHTDKATGEHRFIPEGYVPNPQGAGLIDPSGLEDRQAERKAREDAEKASRAADSPPVAAPAADAKETP
jgi:hypothetical protein